MGSKSSGAPAQPSQQPNSSISNGFGGASNSAASPQIPQQPIAQAVNQTGAVTAPSLTDQVVLQNQNNAIAANQQPNPMAMTAYRNNMSPQIPMPSLTEQPMFQQSYYQRPDQQAMMESLRQIFPNMFGNRYFASGGAVHGYDKETIKNALRIASRKNHPMRLHQTLARTGYAEGGDVPLPPKRPEDLDYYKVLAEAQKDYPFIEKHDPYLKVSPRSEAGYAETFGPTEEGAGEFMRPKEFPLGSTGIEVYRPDEFTPADYAAEFLHVDPKANEARNALIEKLTPRQKEMIMQEPDYTYSIKQKLSPRKALENVTDAMLRGYTMKDKPSHQWPGDFLDKLEFTPEEREIMDSLKDYMTAPAAPGPVVREQKSLGGYPKESAETSGEDIGHRAWETQHDRLNRQIERVQQDKDAYDYKSGGRINTVIDRDPDWKMGLAHGGEVVEEALRLASGGRTPAWSRKEGQNINGGLNAKGRASAKAEGHNLKPPQPEGGPRKKSFCSRMGGMAKKFPAAAKDPDSRLNKSLRIWKCADGGEVWDKPRPKNLGKPKPLSPTQKASAKAAAKAAGRHWPNFVDNVRVSRKD